MNVQSTKSSTLTHNFHYSMSQECSTALQAAKAFDVQWPDIGSRVTIGHPLGKIPREQTQQHTIITSITIFFHYADNSN